MSVISRMLRDLEARDQAAVSPRDAGDLPRRFAPGPERHPRRRRGRSRPRQAAVAALTLMLIGVAAALWWQRGPELLARLVPADGATRPPESAPLAPAASAPPARLTAVRYTGTGREAALALTITGEPIKQPDYARRAAILALRLPAPAAGLVVPPPPDDQQVFRSASLQRDEGSGATLRLRIDPAARFDLSRADGVLTLTGRLPPAPKDDGAEDAPTRLAPPSVPPQADTHERSASPTPEPAPAARAAEPRERAPGPTPPEPSARAAGASDRGPSAAAADRAGDGPGGMRKQDRSSPAVRAERRYRAARTALASGDLGRARHRLRDALALDAELHRARDLLAALHRRAGDTDTARDVLAEGVARAPGRPEYARPYARLLVDAGALARAARVLDAAAGAAGEDSEFHALAGAIAQRRGRHEEAAAAYTRALEIDAANGRWWLGLAVALTGADHRDEAAAAFREARRANTLSPRLDAWARSRIQALTASE